jgi:hypothetical protein
VPVFAESENKAIQHELQYGIINLASLAFIDGDWSEFPVVGASYKYYFLLLPIMNSLMICNPT